MKKFVQKTCTEFGNRLHFFDQTCHEQLYAVMQGAKLVVLPSLVANFPNALLEALALGRTVVETVETSFDEPIEDGQNRFLVGRGDAETLRAKIVAAWVHPNLDEIAKKAQDKVANLAPEAAIPALLAYYAKIIEGPHARTVFPRGDRLGWPPTDSATLHGS